MPIPPSGTAPTMPVRAPSGVSATAQRAPRTPRSRSKALGSADHRTTLLSSRMRSRSASSIRRTRTPESVSPTAFSTFWVMVLSTSVSSLVVNFNKMGPRSLRFFNGVSPAHEVSTETKETRMPRARPLEGRSGQGRSRKPSGKGVRGNRYLITFHAHNATPVSVLLEDPRTRRLAVRRIESVMTAFEGGLDGRTVADQRSRPGRAWRRDPECDGTVGRWTRGRDLTRRRRGTRTGFRDTGPLRQDADACARGRARPPLFLRGAAAAPAG